MAPDSNNIAFLAGMIAAVPGVSALISAPRLGKLDRIGTSRILLATLCAVVMFFAMSLSPPAAIGYAAFSARLCRWRDAPGGADLIAEVQQRQRHRAYLWL